MEASGCKQLTTLAPPALMWNDGFQGGRTRCNMVEYDVDDVSEDLREKVVGELLRIIGASDLDETIRKVVVAADFGEAVRNHLTGSEREAYNPVHQYGVAKGKTIPILDDDQLGFVIVLDARLFADMGAAKFLDRQYDVAHELSHVRNMFLRFQSAGELGPAQASRNKEQYLFEMAWDIWEEYRAERTAADWVRELVRTVSETAELGFNFTVGHADDVLRRLREFGPFLRENIPRYRLGLMDINELVAAVTSSIRDIVVILAYVYALRDFSDRIGEKVSEIEEDPSFLEFFGQRWGAIVRWFDELYEDKATYRPDILTGVGATFDDILLASGMKMSDAEGAYRVEVLDV